MFSDKNKDADFLIKKFQNTYTGGLNALNWTQCQKDLETIFSSLGFYNEFNDDISIDNLVTTQHPGQKTFTEPNAPVKLPTTIEEGAPDNDTIQQNILKNAENYRNYEYDHAIYIGAWKNYNYSLEQHEKEMEKYKKVKSSHAQAFSKLYMLFPKDGDLIDKVKRHADFQKNPTLFCAIKIIGSEVSHVDKSGTQASEFFTKVLNLGNAYKRNDANQMKSFLNEAEKCLDEAQVLKPRYATNDDTSTLNNIVVDLMLAACKSVLPDPNTSMGHCFMELASEIRRDGNSKYKTAQALLDNMNSCLRAYQTELEKENSAAKAKANAASSTAPIDYKGGRYSRNREDDRAERGRGNDGKGRTDAGRKRGHSEPSKDQCVLHPYGVPHTLEDCNTVKTMRAAGKVKELTQKIKDAKDRLKNSQRDEHNGKKFKTIKKERGNHVDTKDLEELENLLKEETGSSKACRVTVEDETDRESGNQSFESDSESNDDE
ncbi:hypothetical protein HDU79_011202 [Rhizoclosmatium sp. JEL0117]|nr:hypothetical protein HDU79_011202 [Rhizoclosmatium sp. JEL0117]